MAIQERIEATLDSAPASAGWSDASIPKSYTASQWQLITRRFGKHRLAVCSAVVVVLLYVMGFGCEFFAPYTLEQTFTNDIYAPPQRLHFFAADGLHLRPFVYALQGARDPETREILYRDNRQKIVPLHFFVKGAPYTILGLHFDTHLFGGANGQKVFLLGTDSLGRGVFSRIVYGAKISLTIGLIGVAMSFVLGLFFGLISGFYGGWIDNLIQRTIDILRSFPAIPLWLALAASLPQSWSPLEVYFGITLVLSLLSWTGLARQVRGKILSLREEDYAVAARLCGTSEWRIMTRHLLPAFFSHIIVVLTLQVPAMILAETALSFLGLGLRPPITSWGVMLKEAQNVQTLALHPWLLSPVLFVILTVLAFNFVGDGLRDAADPYMQ